MKANCRVSTHPGKFWKVMELKSKIFKALESHGNEGWS